MVFEGTVSVKAFAEANPGFDLVTLKSGDPAWRCDNVYGYCSDAIKDELAKISTAKQLKELLSGASISLTYFVEGKDTVVSEPTLLLHLTGDKPALERHFKFDIEL